MRITNIQMTKIHDFCNRWKIEEFALFGSVLKDDFGPDSDIDVLLTWAEGAQWSLFEWVDMQDELGEISPKTLFPRVEFVYSLSLAVS
jgi:predicted nucleotidyltransferase